MKPEVKTFSKDNPCTKADIWNCFRGPRGWILVQVDVAHSMIGKNVPRVMERDGKMLKIAERRGDFYELTTYGKDWLLKGIRSFVRNHPGRVEEIMYPIPDEEEEPAARRARRVRS